MSNEEKALFQRHGIKVVEVPWMLPPGTSQNAGGCASTDLMRLHVFNLTEYV